MRNLRALAIVALIGGAELFAGATPAWADLVLSQLVVELAPGDHSRTDLEVYNNGPERTYVAADPREIIGPGTASESGRTDPDPEKLGLLVSPARMILEPGQRRLLRIASIQPSDHERVYRVTVKPIIGQLSSQASGLKVLVGYDVLVLVRPTDPKPHVSGTRQSDELTLKNDGNVSVELVDGRACDPSSKACDSLPEARLYAGAQKTFKVNASRRADYKLKVGPKLLPVEF